MSLDMNLLLYFQIEIYEDNDNARKDEIAALGDQTATGTNVFSAFYDRLKEVFLSFFLLPVLFGHTNVSWFDIFKCEKFDHKGLMVFWQNLSL